MDIDLDRLPYPSMRQPVFAPRGMVATSQPLAAQAGLEMLRSGGNAVDAAVATAIALTVVEPTMNSIGSDTFALVWDGSRLHGLNGSGRSPAVLTPERVRGESGEREMPVRGWLTVTVPGTPAAWRDLHRRFGRLPFAKLFEPAIHYAESGFPVSPIVVRNWRWAWDQMRELEGAELAGWFAMFAPEGRAPMVGERWASHDLARTLRLLADTECEDFYQGRTAQAIVDFAALTGGLIVEADLAQHESEWTDPIGVRYRGYDVWEMPPNGQGLAALIGLKILDGLDLGKLPRDSVESYHLQIEALKLGFIDAQRYVADPQRVRVPTAGLLDNAYIEARRRLIGKKALEPVPGDPSRGETIYLAAGDADGMMVSLIQSNCSNFGSGIVVPGTGVNLQNRAVGFSLEPGHPNELAPGKRPRHSILPAFLTREGAAIGPFGLVGGHMQPQGHIQLMVNTIVYGLNPQAALDAPRWFWWEGREIKLEPTTGEGIAEGLERRGHVVEVDHEIDVFGAGQVIWRLPSGGYVGGSEGRSDGCAVGY